MERTSSSGSADFKKTEPESQVTPSEKAVDQFFPSEPSGNPVEEQLSRQFFRVPLKVDTSPVADTKTADISDFSGLQSKLQASASAQSDVKTLLTLADKQGLLDIPHSNIPTLEKLNEEFLSEQKNKSLKDLLEDYENCKIGRNLPKNGWFASSQMLVLEALRPIILEKIKEIPPGNDIETAIAMKRFTQGASVVQFSGALDYAHRMGLTGADVTILVVDTMEQDHGKHVKGIVLQMAPGAKIDSCELGEFGDFNRLADAQIINCSFGTGPMAQSTSVALKKAISSGKLVVECAHNQGVALDDSAQITSNPDREFLQNLPLDQKGRLILTGNLVLGNVPASDTNWPGTDSRINEHFIWTLGSDVLSNTGRGVCRMSGTSMATPVVSGAAALVQSFCPLFTPEEVKECLLESADQDFWIHSSELSVHVSPQVKHATKKDKQATWPYNKNYFGKGLLSVRRALDYAYLKREYGLGSKAIREILDFKEQKAATKIQRALRRKGPVF